MSTKGILSGVMDRGADRRRIGANKSPGLSAVGRLEGNALEEDGGLVVVREFDRSVRSASVSDINGDAGTVYFIANLAWGRTFLLGN